MVLQVNLGERSYPIYVGTGYLKHLATLPEVQKYKRIALITDETVYKIFQAEVSELKNHKVIVVPAGEESKSFQFLQMVWDQLVDQRADRKTLLVVLGGGVVGDLGGFAASTYMRGIDFLQIPTTLLSQVDSSVGGKTGINHPKGKNLLGAFYQPIAVYIDTHALNTLPENEFLAGLGEVIKYGVIWDESFLDYLVAHSDAILNKVPERLAYVINRCCAIKAEVVGQDEKEGGLRAILNYGHSIAHGLENVCAYRGVLHGQAVAFGMDVEMLIAKNRKLVSQAVYEKQKEVLKRLKQPFKIPTFEMSKFLSALTLDKKNIDNQLTFILPTKIGKVLSYSDITFAEVEKAVLDVLASNFFH